MLLVMKLLTIRLMRLRKPWVAMVLIKVALSSIVNIVTNIFSSIMAATAGYVPAVVSVMLTNGLLVCLSL